jgi:uncharacterized membrane protein YfcA
MFVPGSPVYYAGAVVIGAAVGFLSGLLGKGGSAVTTPALRVFLGVPRFFALASPLPAALPSTLAAGFAYRGLDFIDWPAASFTCALGIPATLAGSWASQWVGGHTLMLLTALLVTGLGIGMLRHPEERPAGIAPAGGTSLRLKLAFIALGAGFLSGLLANTGGVLYAPLFIQWVRMDVKRALATSLVVSAVLAVPGTIAHALLGHIDWMLVAALSAGALPFSYLGARLAIRLRNATLLRVFGIALALFGLFDLLYTEREALARLLGRG